MTGTRRLSQALAEGDGISVIVDVDGPDAARAADDAGAEAVVVDSTGLRAVREATALPIIWRARPDELADEAAAAGADACVVHAASLEHEGAVAEERFAHARDNGLECVVSVRSGEELETALELLDPEIFLLSPTESDDLEGAVEQVLDLLPDVPAGKLAIAAVEAARRDDVVELERAGVDAVMVARGNVAHLVGAAPPDV